MAILVAAAFLPGDAAANGRQDMLSGVERLENVRQAYAWMHGGLPPNSEVYSAFYCFGPDTHYDWFRSMGLTVPNDIGSGHTYRVWWWNRSALRGHEGYACLAPDADLPSLKRVASQPGEGVFPSEDPAFRPLKTFGQGRSRIEIYRFDLR